MLHSLEEERSQKTRTRRIRQYGRLGKRSGWIWQIRITSMWARWTTERLPLVWASDCS